MQNALRSARSISALCDSHRASSVRSGTAIKADALLQSAAESSLSDARDRLEEIRDRATTVLFEHEERKRNLESLLKSFQVLTESRSDHKAVSKCRDIADAYIRALHPLALHQQDGNMTHMHTVASHVEALIEKVDSVRWKGNKNMFVEDHATNRRIIASIENRVVDAVIKARAAFVNVLDNEFRQFGWPMKIPLPENDSSIIESVNFYVRQLSELQRISNDGDYVSERTKWHRALSDSWAIAAILRAPLARFKYHFLESFRGAENGADHGSTGTSRFDRPEWAAEFAHDRIREATPFLSKVAIDGPLSADVKFAEGFCRVFADKISYDCELAMRASTNDADADLLIAHASETAKQFDAKLRSGILNFTEKGSRDSSSPSFLSSLHILSLNESFLTTWASSELRIADSEVSKLLNRALPALGGDDLVADENGLLQSEPLSRAELEHICQEVVSHIGSSSQKCRALDSQERISKFLKLTEQPLLHALRMRLKEEIEGLDYEDFAPDKVERSGRASFCARLLSDALEDRALDSFYVAQEKRLGFGLYDDEIRRLRQLHSSNCSLLADTISSVFIDSVRGGYADQSRFGEISAPDAAIVLTHDLSQSLVSPLTSLENALSSLSRGIPCRKSASEIWIPVASRLDAFFFDEIVLQCFVGGTRNAMAAASEANDFLKADNSARMARQVAFDTSTFVSTFSVVSGSPAQFLAHSAECSNILQIAANHVLLPSVAPRQEHEEMIEALRKVVESDDDDVSNAVKEVLESRVNAHHIRPREALELLAIGGMRFAIRLM